MRAGVWCGAAALAFIAVANALHTSQVESVAKVGRRLPPTAPESRADDADTKEVPAFKPRISRRREEILGRRGDQLTRTRNRPKAEAEEEKNNSTPTSRNERFDSRRTYSRTRNRHIENEPSPTAAGREYVPRNRTRQSSRERQIPQKNLAPLQKSSAELEDTKSEVYFPTTYKPKAPTFRVTTPKIDDSADQTTQSISTVPTRDSLTTRRRGRINTRVDTRALDLAVSGTTNTITLNHNKEQTTAKNSDDLRNSRKLRYRTRLSETDTNLTGEGILSTNKNSKSSQNKENIPSQTETQYVITETTVQTKTEAPLNQSPQIKPGKSVRQPLNRGKTNFRPATTLKKKHSDEISEDDNYPESFKALLHAKNASTPTNSTSSESLSVKASHKVFNTYTSSPQSTNTGPAKSKYGRFRSKIKAIEPKTEESKTEVRKEEKNDEFIASEQNKSATPEFRLRSGYNSRNRKTSNSSPTAPSAIASSASDISSEKPLHKYNRKFKPSSTEVPNIESPSKFKRLGTNTLLKKSLPRPVYNSRRNANKSLNLSSESPVDNINKGSNSTYIKTLPRTSYYSRYKNKNSTKESIINTEAHTNSTIEMPAEKKIESSADMPLIFSLLKNSSDIETSKEPNKEDILSPINRFEKEKKMFIIAVTSKESSENSTENEVPNKTEEIEEKVLVVNPLSHSLKLSTNFKNENSVTLKNNDQEVNQSTPRSRNYQSTKRNSRIRKKLEFSEGTSQVTPRTRERNAQRKFSEAFTKSTEPSTNGIPPEPEKQKSRYSSKYRSSYIDNPYYKPTIPTVTPSTAWLKFFVTDPQLAKSVEEPFWFGEDDMLVTTEMSRQTTTTSSGSHETSLELVEGEEIQLGPDTNAISFTKTRSTLSSADLRLSESLDKSSHIMNVEASQHSPSVTVSIFDALAEILTSTPRTPRLSSTTDVTQKQNINDITLKGVSNSITVNTIKGLTSQEMFTTIADATSSTKFVQTTVQTPPTVINSKSLEETVTPSLNTQVENISPVNTPTVPTPLSTTPLSARRPFAIKLLYTETEPSSDKMTTTESIRSSILPSIDIPETVLNTVSDFLLTNNYLVSTELTSMLSNNIKNIMQNMDEKTKSKVSVDMAKLLKILVPRALEGIQTGNDNNIDMVQDTTPYSLEEIRDTENVNLDSKNATFEINKNDIIISESLQSLVFDKTVNSKPISNGTTLETPTEAVNMTLNRILSESSGQITLADASLTSAPLEVNSSTIISSSATTPSTAKSSASFDTETISIDGNGNRLDTNNTNRNSINNTLPFPFLTNFEVRDLTSESSDMDSRTSNNQINYITSTQSAPLTESISQVQGSYIKRTVQTQDVNSVSPLQLWVLNKKARVLQMIEDLIRKHNAEIQTAPPMTEFLDQPNNIPLSNRLTEILNTMSSTTKAADITTESNNLPTTTQSLSPFPFISTISTPAVNGESTEDESTSSIFTSIFDNTVSTTTQSATDIFSRLDFTGSDASGTKASTANIDATLSTTSLITTVQETSDASQETTTTPVNIETTTYLTSTEVIQTDAALTTSINSELLPQANVEITAKNTTTEIKQSFVSAIGNQINISNEPPRKDYVIFGILPNNTVVRKDPNEDILETLTEASPYIVYSLLPNNTVIRRFPNGTRVPRVMQKIDVLPISPWTLRNPYSPIHNNPAIVRPHNPIRVSTNIVTYTDSSNNGSENRLTIDTVNNQQKMIPTTPNLKDKSSLGINTVTNKPPAEKSTASHVLSLRTSTMLPSVDEILLNSISSAVREEMVISSMTSSTHEPTILTLDIDPESGQIRTEKPGDGSERTIFKYIPIDEVTVAQQGTNVLKLASTKAPPTPAMTTTEVVTPEIQTLLQTSDPTTTVQIAVGTSTPIETTTVFTNTSLKPGGTPVTETNKDILTSTEAMMTTLSQSTMPTETITVASEPYYESIVTTPLTAVQSTTALPTTSEKENMKFQQVENILSTERNAKSFDVFNPKNQIPFSEFTTLTPSTNAQQDEKVKLLQAILAADYPSSSTVSIPKRGDNLKPNTANLSSTSRTIEDDIRQFEEDTKLLKALLAATGQNPVNLNIPSLDSLNFNILTTATPSPVQATQQTDTTVQVITTPMTTTTYRTTPMMTTTSKVATTTPSINDDLKKLTEDAQLLATLLQATGKNNNKAKPIISSITSNVRIASDPKTTTVYSNPTTPANIRPVFTNQATRRPAPVISTLSPELTTNLQQNKPSEANGISTTLRIDSRRRIPATTVATARRVPNREFSVTTEIPSTSTFSDEEDLQFLQNLKSVLNNNPNTDDPEAGLANRIIALAVERSLNEIESGKQGNDGRTGKTVVTTPMTKPVTTTTTTTTSTTLAPTTKKDNTPSLEDDIKQFQEDTKLLQALLKATGQDPSKFNIPTLPPMVNSDTKVSPQIPARAQDDLKLLSNLLASPSPLNEPFDSLNETKPTVPTTPKPFGAKIVVKDNLKTQKDDANLLQTLVKLQGVSETTTQRSKLALTGQSPEEALKKLVQQTKSPGMMSDATKAPVSISTEYGKSNDALLAALLKEQGFGPTTASSLDEQLRLAALLNQVVVTPKARRTTTLPPPPPPPPARRPILDGLAWLWQQWRETDPGRPVARPNRRPSIPSSAPPSGSSSNRVPWFGSGPFIGNADDQPTSNRVPLEPPRAVASEAPGRGQLVSAAINVTRAFSQFLGAAIAGAAQTVQSVIRAGQRATAEAYTTGSG